MNSDYSFDNDDECIKDLNQLHLDKFILDKQIGSGTFGDVFLIKEKKN